MKTKQQIIDAFKSGRKSTCLDGRDYSRLVDFFDTDEWPVFGFVYEPHGPPPAMKEWTKKAVIEEMRKDVEFAFEKALSKRGMLASLMNSVVRVWLWVLDDDSHKDAGYENYGLPLLKSVANKYGFPNPIGDKRGDECEFRNDD